MFGVPFHQKKTRAETTLWRTLVHFRVVRPHVSSMAAKNNHRKKSSVSKKDTQQPEDNVMEEENCDDEGDMVDDEHQAEADGFNLDDVLWLGGTQVNSRKHSATFQKNDVV